MLIGKILINRSQFMKFIMFSALKFALYVLPIYKHNIATYIHVSTHMHIGNAFVCLMHETMHVCKSYI